MKITIDTKEDSVGELKKLISLLSSLVEGKEVVSNKNIFEQEETPQENVLGNLFGTEKVTEIKNDETIEKKEIEKDDKPDVEIY